MCIYIYTCYLDAPSWGAHLEDAEKILQTPLTCGHVSLRKALKIQTRLWLVHEASISPSLAQVLRVHGEQAEELALSDY